MYKVKLMGVAKHLNIDAVRFETNLVHKVIRFFNEDEEVVAHFNKDLISYIKKVGSDTKEVSTAVNGNRSIEDIARDIGATLDKRVQGIQG